eukprot:scaffold624_cov402-Prasinococcus_capsulatus_cf.AAC.11
MPMSSRFERPLLATWDAAAQPTVEGRSTLLAAASQLEEHLDAFGFSQGSNVKVSLPHELHGWKLHSKIRNLGKHGECVNLLSQRQPHTRSPRA